MRKVFGILLKVISGFFFYLVTTLAFVSEPSKGAKAGILIGFTVPAVAALAGGLTLTRFRNWRRDTGIVLLCGAGFTGFLIFTLACFLMTDEFRGMMRPDTLSFFSDYLTGGVVMFGLAVMGSIFLKQAKEEPNACQAVVDQTQCIRANEKE